MDFTQTPDSSDVTSAGVIDLANSPGPSPLTSGTAIAYSALLDAPNNTVSFDDLADLYWPQDRPVHWKGLISFYGRWLHERLPADWTITDDADQLRLTGQEDSLNYQALCDRVVTDLPRGAWQPPRLTPTVTTAYGNDPNATPGVQALLPGQIDTSDAISIPLMPTAGLGNCASHRSALAQLPALTREAPLAVVTHQPGQPAPEPSAWREMLAASGRTPGFVFVAGATPDLPFGDLAAAFAPARWKLLEIEGRNEQSRVAAAWRIIRDHLPPQDGPASDDRCAVIFDAHRLDPSSLELAQLLVRFPLADNIRIVFVGDLTDPRSGWQNFLQACAESDCPRFEMCSTCDPTLLAGHQVEHQTALCG